LPIRRQFIYGALFAALNPIAVIAGAEPPEPSCGAMCILVLARLQESTVDLPAIQAELGPPSFAGHSIKQMASALEALGMPCSAVSVLPSDWPIQGMGIFHTQNGERGHYVVVRPVGHSGQLAQVLDPTGSVLVEDYEALAQAPGWTGSCLLIHSPRTKHGLTAVTTVATACGFLAIRRLARRYVRSKCERLLPGSTRASQFN